MQNEILLEPCKKKIKNHKKTSLHRIFLKKIPGFFGFPFLC